MRYGASRSTTGLLRARLHRSSRHAGALTTRGDGARTRAGVRATRHPGPPVCRTLVVESTTNALKRTDLKPFVSVAGRFRRTARRRSGPDWVQHSSRSGPTRSSCWRRDNRKQESALRAPRDAWLSSAARAGPRWGETLLLQSMFSCRARWPLPPMCWCPVRGRGAVEGVYDLVVPVTTTQKVVSLAGGVRPPELIREASRWEGSG